MNISLWKVPSGDTVSHVFNKDQSCNLISQELRVQAGTECRSQSSIRVLVIALCRREDWVSVPFPIKIDSLIKLAIGSHRPHSEPSGERGKHGGEGARPGPVLRLTSFVIWQSCAATRSHIRTEAGDYSNILQPLTFPSFNSAAKFPQNAKVDKMIPASSWCQSSPAFCQSLSLSWNITNLIFLRPGARLLIPRRNVTKRIKGKNCHALKLKGK